MLEDMLWCCVLDFLGSWDRYIPLMEFAYNNSYRFSIGMARMKLCMEEDVELLCVRQSWASIRLLVLI